MLPDNIASSCIWHNSFRIYSSSAPPPPSGPGTSGRMRQPFECRHPRPAHPQGTSRRCSPFGFFPRFLLVMFRSLRGQDCDVRSFMPHRRTAHRTKVIGVYLYFFPSRLGGGGRLCECCAQTTPTFGARLAHKCLRVGY